MGERNGTSSRWNEDLDFLAREMPATHANLFHTLGRQQFDGVIADIRRHLPRLARHQFIVELMRLAAAIGDGHTSVSLWRDPVGFHTLPLSLYRFPDGYYVRAATHDHAACSAPALPMSAVSPSTRQWMSGSADKWWKARNGWVDHRDGAAEPPWLSQLTETYWFSYLPEGDLLYCQLNEIRERGERLDAFFARALAAADSLGARRFVLDLRHNGGGDGDLNRSIVRALLRSRFDERGQLFVITSRRTFSAAQMLVCDLEKWALPIFVGEPAASRSNHYGDSALLVLPNERITTRVSTLWWQWDPRDVRPWIAVDLAAPLTVDAYRAGRDPALEAIAAF